MMAKAHIAKKTFGNTKGINRICKSKEDGHYYFHWKEDKKTVMMPNTLYTKD